MCISVPMDIARNDIAPTSSCEPCRNFRDPVGLHIRVIECATGVGLPGGTAQYGTHQNFDDIHDSIADQISTRDALSTSVLRNDLPMIIYAGNRSFGFVLNPPAQDQFSCAYPMDAWTGRSHQRPQCSGDANERARAYSLRDHYRDECKRHEDALLAQRARARNRVLSCCYASVSSALEVQRIFTAITRNESECVRQRVNNQVSRSWRLSDIQGVFFVAPEMRRSAEATLRKLHALRSPNDRLLSLIQLAAAWPAPSARTVATNEDFVGDCKCLTPRGPSDFGDTEPALGAVSFVTRHVRSVVTSTRPVHGLRSAKLARLPQPRMPPTRTPMVQEQQGSSTDARSCLQTMGETSKRNYLRKVYGSAPHHEASAWKWEMVDVIWLHLLDDAPRHCILLDDDVGHGHWITHRGVGFYMPPIGSKMRYPVVWQYRNELRCAGDRSENGGKRGLPVVVDGTWVEIFHYYGGLGTNAFEASHLWFYLARGSGVWYFTGPMLVFADTADLVAYLQIHYNEKQKLSKRQLIQRAYELLGGRYSTISFSHHVDYGFNKQRVCQEPGPGWDRVYFYLTELVVFRANGTNVRQCPPLRDLRSGWPSTGYGQCESCDPFVESRAWPQLAKDSKWQLRTLRCNTTTTL